MGSRSHVLFVCGGNSRVASWTEVYWAGSDRKVLVKKVSGNAICMNEKVVGRGMIVGRWKERCSSLNAKAVLYAYCFPL